jgi:BirA family transcriptional regulator, biotin operon repressor / biotin---[acetyl-CoA-carboxylase] ligase
MHVRDQRGLSGLFAQDILNSRTFCRLECNDYMPFDLASARLRLPGREIEWFQSVSSTMTIAARHAWHSEAGAGLYVSIVLRLPLAASDLPLVMLALGLGTQEAITQVTGLAADLRWPNDVLIGDRKCAGILAQLDSDAVIAGIGINVNHTQFPSEIETLATSLYLAGQRSVSREDLLVSLVHGVEGCCKILSEAGGAAILRMFTRASSYASGRRVRVQQDERFIEGVTCGLDSAGFLVVRSDDGKETTILTGGVRPA